jgi:hypothetical protein
MLVFGGQDGNFQILAAYGPTATHRRCYDNAASRFTPVLATLHSLIQTDLAQLERQADAAGPRGHPAACRIGTRRDESSRDAISPRSARAVDGTQPPGEREEGWDGRNERGTRAPSGVYLSRLAADGTSRGCNLTLTKRAKRLQRREPRSSLGPMSAPWYASRRRWAWVLTATLVAIRHETALGQPGARYLPSAIYDAPHQSMVVFGGYLLAGAANDVWRLTLDRDASWNQVVPTSLPPLERFGHSAIYDPVGDQMIIFGGEDNNQTVLSDAWALSLSDPPTWRLLGPAGPIPALTFHTAIYDPPRNRMLVFGGQDASHNPSSDVWSLSLSPPLRWERLPNKGSLPVPRYLHSAIYDPVRDRMLVYGGDAPLGDVWAMAIADTVSWTRIDPSGTPPPARFGHSAIYDPVRDRMVVFGGNDGNQPLGDAWQLSLGGSPMWAPLPPSGDAPSARGYHAAVLDTTYHRMAIFGGFPFSTNSTDATWALSLGPDTQWSPFRPLVQASEDDLRFPTVTIGDTVAASFVLSNLGLKQLHVSDVTLPRADLRLSHPAPLDLGWKEAVSETLTLIPSQPDSTLDSLAILSNDPLPAPHIRVRVDIRGLDFKTRVLGDPVSPLGASMLVVTTPESGVHIERGVLYFRVAESASAFDSIALTPLATDFIAAIPISAVTEHGVEYSVRVENGDFSASTPVLTQPVGPPTEFTAIARPTSGTDFVEADSIEVEALLPAGAVFGSGTIQYRRGGEEAYESSALAMGPVGRPIGVIPGRVVGPRGVEYRVAVSTLTQTLEFPAAASPPERIRVRVQNLMESTVHPGVRYRLLSLPLDFSAFAGSLDALLTDQLGSYDPVRWRAYTYDPESGSNVEFSAAQAASFRPQPGRAFWLISRDAHSVNTAPIVGSSTQTGEDYRIALSPGWNLFGNPFDFPVAWSAVSRNSATVGDPIAFDPGLGKIGDYAAETPSTLTPFEGYFIHAIQPETLRVAPREAPTPASLAAGAPGPGPGRAGSDSNELWSFWLRAGDEQAEDGSNRFGVRTDAAEGFDPFDTAKPPPPPGPWVQVAFVHPEWGSWSGPYRRDLRGPGAPGETWEIEVRTDSPAEDVALDLSEAVPGPPGLALRLIDREQSRWVDAEREAGGGSPRGIADRIVSFGPHPYRLAIVAGSDEYVAHATRQTLSVPSRTLLEGGAPNPFRIATRLRFGLPVAERVSFEIFSVLGQRVAAPFDHEPLEAGYHTVVWDGKIRGGGTAPNGVYLVRLTAGRETLTGRIVLVR